ncbi:pathogenesis-related protein PRB1-2-like [Phragmites australis]|uniref:pathogenesis-related protein PRB1-2-like n=1 Tax=Phragmites australis TaxID=29695 RepID=UPI002D7A066A|nr:pathogenesis-related protein PRB1-2-like [Phragmites australis]
METPKMAAVAFVLVVTMATTSMAQNPDQEFVALHNAARGEVGVGDVVWDHTVAAFARAYAARRAGDCKLGHSDDHKTMGYGENVYVGPAGKDWTVAEAMEMWVNERQNYDNVSGRCMPQKMCEHYMQVVWRSTTAIGCARVKCDNGGVFITCNYAPAGNVPGQRPY